MAKYFVKYRVGDQILESGTIGAIPDVEAPNVRAVFDVVRAAGGTVISVEEIRESALARFWDKLLHLNLNFRFGASASEWAMLCDILGALLKSGVSVLNAEMRRGRAAMFRAQCLGDVAHLLRDGEPVSASGAFSAVQQD